MFLLLIGLSYLVYNIFSSPSEDKFPTFPEFSPKVKWDISKKESNIIRAFSIPIDRSYTYAFFVFQSKRLRRGYIQTTAKNARNYRRSH